MKVEYIEIILFAIMAIAFWNEKGSWLFAGYNMMSNEEKQRYDRKKLCRVMSCCMGAVDLLLIISCIMGENDRLENVLAVIGIGVVILTVILSNTVCRKNR